MADRYWVGGTATWDATAGSKWALTSGGAGGQAVPTSNDDVYIDAVSSANTITLGAAQNCKSLNFVDGTGGQFAGTFAVGSSAFNIYGGVKLSSTMTITGSSSTWTMRATTTGWEIWHNTNHTYYWTFAGAGGGWTFKDDIVLVGTNNSITQNANNTIVFEGNFTTTGGSNTAVNISQTNGTMSFGAGTFNLGYINSTGATARAMNFNSAAFTLSANNGSGPIILSGSNLTFNGGTSSIITTGATPLINIVGYTIYDIDIRGAAGTCLISGGFSCHNFFVTPTTTKELTIHAGGVITVSGACTYNGSPWAPFAIATSITPSSMASDNYAPATFTTEITLSCVVVGADNVSVQIHDKSIDLVNTGGNNWSKTIYAGYFGTAATQTIYFTSRTDAGATASGAAGSTITIPAITAKTTTLLSEITASLASASITATCSLIGEEVIGSSIRSLIKIAVTTYSVATIDAVRTAVAAAVGGWSGTVTAVEYAAPVNSTSSIVIYKMSHS